MIELSVPPCTCGHRMEYHWLIQSWPDDRSLEGRRTGCGQVGCGCAEYSATQRNFPHEQYAARSAACADDAVRFGLEGNEEAAVRAAELADLYARQSREYLMARVA